MPESLYNQVNQVNTAARNERLAPATAIQQSRAFRPPAGAELFVAKVVSDATGGGYYNCYPQTIDATYWETNTSAMTNAEADPVSIVVLNLAENYSSVHNLAANDLIVCWKKTDDEGNSRYEGVEVFGRHNFGEW